MYTINIFFCVVRIIDYWHYRIVPTYLMNEFILMLEIAFNMFYVPTYIIKICSAYPNIILKFKSPAKQGTMRSESSQPEYRLWHLQLVRKPATWRRHVTLQTFRLIYTIPEPSSKLIKQFKLRKQYAKVSFVRSLTMQTLLQILTTHNLFCDIGRWWIKLSWQLNNNVKFNYSFVYGCDCAAQRQKVALLRRLF